MSEVVRAGYGYGAFTAFVGYPVMSGCPQTRTRPVTYIDPIARSSIEQILVHVLNLLEKPVNYLLEICAKRVVFVIELQKKQGMARMKPEVCIQITTLGHNLVHVRRTSEGETTSELGCAGTRVGVWCWMTWYHMVSLIHT